MSSAEEDIYEVMSDIEEDFDDSEDSDDDDDDEMEVDVDVDIGSDLELGRIYYDSLDRELRYNEDNMSENSNASSVFNSDLMDSFDPSSSSDENSSDSYSEAVNMPPTTSTAAATSLQPTETIQQPPGSIINQQSTIGSETIQQTSESMINQQSTSGSVTTQQPTSSHKKLKTENINNDCKTEDDAFSCSICLEGLTNTGTHKPACLKCGHIFGLNCLERWIKVGCNNEARRCPSCNAKASLRDIRVLYAKQLIVIDNAEVTALQRQLEYAVSDKYKVMAEADKVKVNNQYLKTEVERLLNIIENNKNGLPDTSGPSSSRQRVKKINLCKNPSCRIMCYNKNNMMLAVGQHSDSPLFSNSHVIRKLNASILEPSKECIYAHAKQIRDMSFHPNENNLLASVSLDKCIKLIDMGSNSVVSSLDVQEALWSCCWAGDNPNMLIAGGQLGSLYQIDRRYMKLLDAQRDQKFACVSLVPLPPSSSRCFINGGFLKTRMDLISVFEQNNMGEEDFGLSKYKNTPLPLKGHWTSCSYDSQSNLLLTSSKPCGANKSIRHIVSKLSDFNVEGSLINPVVTFYGGDKATQLSRSCIVPANGLNQDSLVCSYDERSNHVKLFSINSGNNIHNFPVNENILDLCPLNNVILNGRRTVAGLSDNSISIFSV